ncbi:metallophosphoesterase family protein [Oceanobacillus neutriphilus]|uniref:DeoR family transcriptional regulator n=1 Tax=Oceanobacillus neutriphilus TaxID=531815 RepID=A0ABQ2NU65_9BACI|nr:metallophosphoesterase family protein [Oceanobacillus neutriphilus]GGP10655.1 DeoR family transcriptional regulator [Oceanobacillus neutriphilus]
MVIAAIYDIHGNLPALNAVLEELEEINPDTIIIGGDIVSGPMPGETLERLLSLDGKVDFIRGNGDREVVMAFDGKELPFAMSEKGREKTKWVAEQLTQYQRDFLSELPASISIPVDGLGDVLFCHATPRSDEEIFTPLTPPERLNHLFSDIQQRFVICGHTHMLFERSLENTHIYNAGSVGMPFADKPGAYWLLLSPKGIEFRYTSYNFEMAAQEIKASGDPQAHEFAEKNVIEIPTALEAAKILEQR